MFVTRLLPVVALIAAFVGGPLGAGAQTPPPPAPGESAAPMTGGHHGHHHRESLMRALNAVNLSAAQKKQIATFHDQEKAANLNADPATKQANGAKMRQQIMGILTPDQKTQLSAEIQRSRSKQPAGSQQPGAPMANPSASPGSN